MERAASARHLTLARAGRARNVAPVLAAASDPSRSVVSRAIPRIRPSKLPRDYGLSHRRDNRTTARCPRAQGAHEAAGTPEQIPQPSIDREIGVVGGSRVARTPT